MSDELSWDEKADDHAVAHHTFEHLSGEMNQWHYGGIVKGAKWQRDQLRTDEAIERVAVWLFTRSWKPSIDADKGATWWERLDEEGREPWLTEARAAITAVLGDD